MQGRIFGQLNDLIAQAPVLALAPVIEHHAAVFIQTGNDNHEIPPFGSNERYPSAFKVHARIRSNSDQYRGQ